MAWKHLSDQTHQLWFCSKTKLQTTKKLFRTSFHVGQHRLTGPSVSPWNTVKSGELPCDLRVNERRWLCNVAALQCVPSPALMALPCLLSCCMYLDRWGRGQPTLPRGVSAVEVKQKTDFHETQIAPNYKFNLNDKIFGPAVLRTRLLVSVYQVLVTTVKKQLRQDVRKSLCEPQKKHHSSTAVL